MLKIHCERLVRRHKLKQVWDEERNHESHETKTVLSDEYKEFVAEIEMVRLYEEEGKCKRGMQVVLVRRCRNVRSSHGSGDETHQHCLHDRLED
jgi:hypothetical protein